MANNIIDDHIRGCPACGYRWSCRQKVTFLTIRSCYNAVQYFQLEANEHFPLVNNSKTLWVYPRVFSFVI